MSCPISFKPLKIWGIIISKLHHVKQGVYKKKKKRLIQSLHCNVKVIPWDQETPENQVLGLQGCGARPGDSSWPGCVRSFLLLLLLGEVKAVRS